MIGLRWRKAYAHEPNSVLLELGELSESPGQYESTYAVLQYRDTDSDFYYPYINENGIKTLTRINPDWQDVEISDE
jgi:hypothetical protein